jgi:hypothetical protein
MAMLEGNIDWQTNAPFIIKSGVFITDDEVAGGFIPIHITLGS